MAVRNLDVISSECKNRMFYPLKSKSAQSAKSTRGYHSIETGFIHTEN